MAEARMFYEKDCNLSLLDGKTIAVIGYGSQGHAVSNSFFIIKDTQSVVFARKRRFFAPLFLVCGKQKGRLMRPFFVIPVFSSSDRAAYSSVFWCSSA